MDVAGKAKSVRIKSGHEAIYIERRRRSNSKRSKKSKPRMKARKRSGGPSDAATPSNRTSVAELVYKLLGQASGRNVRKSLRTSATSQFRKLQRRKHSKRLGQPRQRAPVLRRREPDERPLVRDLSQLLHALPQTPEPDGDAKMKKCILEVLSVGALLGFFVPTAGNEFDITPKLGSMLD